LAFDGFAATRWEEFQEAEADKIDVGPATDLQNDLFEVRRESLLMPFFGPTLVDAYEESDCAAKPNCIKSWQLRGAARIQSCAPKTLLIHLVSNQCE
jgi:hypothetical protein